MTKQRKRPQSLSTAAFPTDPIARAIRSQWHRGRLLVPVLLAGALAAAPVYAATINVTANAVDQDDNNANCSIVEAFLSAETNSAYGGPGGCTAGSGDDVIVLPANSTFSFDGEDGFDHWVGGGALPEVHTVIAVTGNGSRLTATGGEGFRLISAGEGGALTLDDVDIDGGSADYGGNVLVYDGILTLIDSTVSDNQGLALRGGGIAVLGGEDGFTPTLNLSNSSVTGNEALLSGGGILNDGGVVTIANSTIANNTVKYTGGGIANVFGGQLTVTGSTLSGNTAEDDEGPPPCEICVLDKALDDIHGGGLYNDEATATLVNSTLSGNTSSYDGGAIYNDGDLTLTNVTVTDNTAKYVGGVANFAFMSLTNVIIAGNTGTNVIPNCYDASLNGNAKSAGRYRNASAVARPKLMDAAGVNLSEDPGNCSGFTLSVAINLGALADNGGPTQTHALLTGSAAINSGDQAECTEEGVTNDQRGFARDGACDVGAFEFGAGPDAGTVRRGISISFNNNLIPEAGGQTSFRVRVHDAHPVDIVVGLRYEGDAILGTDFSAPGSLTIPAGFEGVTGVIQAIDDSLDELRLERIRIIATSVEGTSGEGRRAIAAIIDDDATPPVTAPGLRR